MKDAFVLVVASILSLACTGLATAQKVELSPEMKKWEPFVGNWSVEFEGRESPEGAWVKASGTMGVHSEGYFLDIRRAFEVGEHKVSAIEIIGWDPLKRTYISSGFSSAGGHAGVTSMDWNGRTLKANFTGVTPRREALVAHATWEFSSDFKSVTFAVEGFSDGQWWTAEKGKCTKVE